MDSPEILFVRARFSRVVIERARARAFRSRVRLYTRCRGWNRRQADGKATVNLFLCIQRRFRIRVARFSSARSETADVRDTKRTFTQGEYMDITVNIRYKNRRVTKRKRTIPLLRSTATPLNRLYRRRVRQRNGRGRSGYATVHIKVIYDRARLRNKTARSRRATPRRA